MAFRTACTEPNDLQGVNCNDLLRATPVMVGRNPSELPTDSATPSLLKDCLGNQQCDCASTFHPIHNSPYRQAHSLLSVQPGPAITCMLFYSSRSPKHISEAGAFSYRARVAMATGLHRPIQTSLYFHIQGSGSPGFPKRPSFRSVTSRPVSAQRQRSSRRPGPRPYRSKGESLFPIADGILFLAEAILVRVT